VKRDCGGDAYKKKEGIQGVNSRKKKSERKRSHTQRGEEKGNREQGQESFFFLSFHRKMILVFSEVEKKNAEKGEFK